jgi:hypothetical protein
VGDTFLYPSSNNYWAFIRSPLNDTITKKSPDGLLSTFYNTKRGEEKKLIMISLYQESFHKEFLLLGYNAVELVEIQPTFQRNMSLRTSGSKETPSNKPARSKHSLLFEDGGHVFRRNVG